MRIWMVISLAAVGGCAGDADGARAGGAASDQASEGSGLDGVKDAGEDDLDADLLGGAGIFSVDDDFGVLQDGGQTTDTAADCGVLVARVRDFREGHPDFQTFMGTSAYLGIVEDGLDSERKPVYAHTGATEQTTGPDEFNQWYRDVDGVNIPFDIKIPLAQTADNLFVYDDSDFFPIDGAGFGNEGNEHNYHFTTEIHLEFVYRGGERFTFEGDDDLWLFVNGRLALDLGGLHEPRLGTVDMDAAAAQLELEAGKTYPMDIFHAERRTVLSNFRIETNIECIVPVLL